MENNIRKDYYKEKMDIINSKIELAEAYLLTMLIVPSVVCLVSGILFLLL